MYEHYSSLPDFKNSSQSLEITFVYGLKNKHCHQSPLQCRIFLHSCIDTCWRSICLISDAISNMVCFCDDTIFQRHLVGLDQWFVHMPGMNLSLKSSKTIILLKSFQICNVLCLPDTRFGSTTR